VRTASVIALLATAAAGAGGGRLLSVRPVAGPDATLVQLDADQPLSFTTLKLAGPPRVVVDLAETTVAGVPAGQEVGDGAVRRIAVAAAGAHTARVVIELAGDVEFDVRAAGNRIEVRVPRAAALARSDSADGGEGTAAATPIPTATPIATATAIATPTATATATPIPTATATATTTATPTATPTATFRAEPDHTQIPEIREREGLPTVALVGAKRTESGERPPHALERPRARALAAGHAAITGIGFRPQAGGEVIVRSDRPLQYGVSSSDRAVLLHLPNAAIPVANNRRPLDTRFFGGPVQRVVPQEVKGGTEVRIELREPAEVHLNQSGSLLTVSFTPGS